MVSANCLVTKQKLTTYFIVHFTNRSNDFGPNPVHSYHTYEHQS